LKLESVTLLQHSEQVIAEKIIMPIKKPSVDSPPPFKQVLKRSALNFFSMTPMLFGVIGLVGLFQVLVTPKMLASLFQGNPFMDTLIGTVTGGISAGHPMISYVLGGELLKQGISLYAVSAFILSWVTLGLIQIPAEIEVFGKPFTLYRNILAFIFTLIIAVLTSFTVYLLT